MFTEKENEDNSTVVKFINLHKKSLTYDCIEIFQVCTYNLIFQVSKITTLVLGKVIYCPNKDIEEYKNPFVEYFY